MPRIDDENKQELKQQIWLKVQQNHGIRTQEIATRLNLQVRRLNNYLRELKDEGKIEQQGWGWHPLEFRGPRLYRFELSPEEVITLYLGARLLVKQHDHRNEPAETALRKLASVLRSDAPIGKEIERVADELAQRGENRQYQSIFRVIVEAYAYRWKIKLEYKPLGEKAFTTTFATYLIEPSLVGAATYIIGESSIVKDIREYKLGRIQSVEMIEESYNIPEKYQGLEVMRHAWSVIGGEAKIDIVLRFSPDVRERVLETEWHPLQLPPRDDPERPGWLRWEAKVPSTVDMVPWIRSWGADCEVLKPKELRAEVIQHVRDLAIQYKVTTTKMNAYSLLWAKADKKDSSKIHRLVYHLIDVGQVALAMWTKAIDKETKRKFCEWLKCDEETAGRTLAFLISLHDLGKASPTFQLKIKHQPIIDEIRKAGFWLPKNNPPESSPHGVVSTWILWSLLPKILKVSERDATMIAKALGGHHGTWPTPPQIIGVNPNDKGSADLSWDTVRQELVQAMIEIFNPALVFSLPENQEELNVMLTLFSGFTSVADWVGSMTEHFPYENSTNLPLSEYVTRSTQAAETALTQLGWFGWQADGKTLKFKEMFPFEMNSVQERVVEEVGKISQPAFLILESPTGSGKTEAALYAADTWLQSQRGHGMYIAMPTQATSNQMYDRVTKFLLKRYPKEILNFHLVHGGALLEDKKPIEMQEISDNDQNNNEGSVRAETWFLPRKRTLLAPFGVGTVDQALMSVLQTRHFFVRMFGLQNKVVVFDEVHAYDTYMSELFKQLLRWLSKIGVSVILLSATLPEKTRRELTAAYLGKKEVDLHLPPAEYPRLTIAVVMEEPKSIPLESQSSRTVQLEWSDIDPKIIVEKLKASLRDGGCAAVICNRVQRAQDVFNEIKLAGLVPEGDLILFHARFPFQWRKEIEDEVLDKFGKNADDASKPNPFRPTKSIVVATQVIEQSLDLDFDYMISDIAPVDLLIQRAGRLHRHSQNDSSRPENLKNAKMQIVSPKTDVIPKFGYDEKIYDRSIMLKTWLTLKDETEMNLPSQTTFLIEKVYGEDFEINDEVLQKEMEEAIEKAEQEERKAISKAERQLIGKPTEPALLKQENSNLDEEDPTVHAAFRAMTRDAEPSISLICLHRVGEKLYLDPANTETPLDTTAKPDKDLVKELLRRSVSLQHYAVVDHFKDDSHGAKWKEWKEVAALKYSVPIVFENGRCKLEEIKYTLVLDRQTGITIQKEDQ
jgi:CRISPR-associated endonuclease/helicase Cas3